MGLPNLGKTPKSQIKAVEKYQKYAIRQIKFGFHRELDSDILEHLDKQQNKQGYIKDLIRADIAKQKGE